MSIDTGEPAPRMDVDIYNVVMVEPQKLADIQIRAYLERKTPLHDLIVDKKSAIKDLEEHLQFISTPERLAMFQRTIEHKKKVLGCVQDYVSSNAMLAERSKP